VTFVGVALVLTGAAYVTTRDRAQRGAVFNDQGEAFFPEFKDPLACTDLEVVGFDPSTATANRFQVMFKDKRWVIPSHYNYPADAKDRLAKTAAAVMDLSKDTIRSDSPEDQEAMGVIDPLDTKVSTLQGRGKRVTLRDASEKVLADLIIGNEIKGTERKEGSGGLRYVRVPGQKRVYGVNVRADLSTRFADWIETNLLKLESGKIHRVFFDNYKIQEARDAQGSFLQRVVGEKITISRKDSTGPWTMADLSADQELNEDKVRTLVDALSDLKIVGIRPKPPGLKDPDQKGLRIPALVLASLQNKGFYLTREGLFSDQGDVIVSTEEGVVYKLRYGGPIFGSGDELTAGLPDDAEKKKEDGKDQQAKKDAAKKSEGTQENRYLIVTVSFDQTLIPKPESLAEKKPAPKPTGLVDIPDKAFAPDPNDPKYQAEQKEAKEKAERDKSDYEKKIADGQKKVKDLADRFGPWYYVTPGDSFRSINLDRAILTQPKKPPTTAGSPSSPLGQPSIQPGNLPPVQP
jgi:hypothetical protein